MVLEQVKRDPAILVDGHNLTVQERVWLQAFAGKRYVGKLMREVVSAAGPQHNATFIAPGEAAIAIELDLVLPGRPLRKLLYEPGVQIGSASCRERV